MFALLVGDEELPSDIFGTYDKLDKAPISKQQVQLDTIYFLRLKYDVDIQKKQKQDVLAS